MSWKHNGVIRVHLEEPLGDVGEQELESVGILLGVAYAPRKEGIPGEDEVRGAVVLEDVRD
jgi:hypothetical protein